MLNLVLFITFLVLVAVALIVWAGDEYSRVKAGEKWPDNWHELVK